MIILTHRTPCMPSALNMAIGIAKGYKVTLLNQQAINHNHDFKKNLITTEKARCAEVRKVKLKQVWNDSPPTFTRVSV